MFSQGKRNDILRELELLENPNAEVEKSTLSSDHWIQSGIETERLLHIDGAIALILYPV